MNYIIISDTHLGDHLSSIATKEDEKYKLGEGYKEFKKKITDKIKDGKTFDYLILLGDIFDIAIKDYDETYKLAKLFFNQVIEDKLVKKGFIYVPGNHDFEMWHLAQYEVNIINKLKKGEDTKKFKHSVPGIIDLRTGTNREEFTLHNVTPLNEDSDAPRYGGLYLDNLIENNENSDITFSIAYPNLYVATDEGTVLLTHGHYFDIVWSAISKYAPILEKKLKTKDIVDYVSLNFPLNQLISSGVGQAGKFTEVISAKIELEVKKGNYSRIRKYISKLPAIIEDYLEKSYSEENSDESESTDLLSKGMDLFSDFVHKKFSGAKSKSIGFLLTKVANYINEKYFYDRKDKESFARGNKKFLKNNNYIVDYFNASVEEISQINNDSNTDGLMLISDIKNIIFGHTHIPTSWEAGQNVENIKNIENIKFHNTGGWLKEVNNNEAEIFFIIDGKFSSKRVNFESTPKTQIGYLQ